MTRLEGYGWYVNDGQRQQGPMSASDILAMVQTNTLRRSHLLWRDGLPEWIEAGSISDLFDSKLPPPLPNRSFPVQRSQDALDDTKRGFKDFLESDLTWALVGPKSEFYRRKWERIYLKTDGNMEKVMRTPGWSWMIGAFLFPEAWLIYRKMYASGVKVFILEIGIQILAIYNILPETNSTILSYLPSLFVCVFGPHIYLQATHKKWLKLLTEEINRDDIEVVGGVNRSLGIATATILIAIEILMVLALANTSN